MAPGRNGTRLLVIVSAALLGPVPVPAADDDGERSGRELYEAACAACHGRRGTGQPQVMVGFDVALPDFTVCGFATREPDADWAAVVHDGGPARGFAAMMPAFGEALTGDEIARILAHVRTLCGDAAWPRGELNLPRPMVTEKAYPEDELVLTTGVATTGPGAVANELVYEKRFGARNQLEVSLPVDFLARDSGGWHGGVGDVALGVKRALLHGVDGGSILSVAGEIVLPTGDEDRGLGKGVAVFEPFVSFGQILPADAFLHAQGGLELPFDTERSENEGFWRVVLGRSFTEGRFGRTWSPMVELLGSAELEGGGAQWDLLPQLQVTLNTRQHVMLNVGVRLPLDERDTRDTTLLVYVLWDWFDGGFFEGW